MWWENCIMKIYRKNYNILGFNTQKKTPTREIRCQHNTGSEPKSLYTRGLLWRVTRYVITFRSEAMALPDWIITLVATSSFICFCLCLRYRRTGQVFWRKLFSKIMARTEKPLFRIAWVWRHFPWRQGFLSFPWRFSWRSLATSSHFYVP